MDSKDLELTDIRGVEHVEVLAKDNKLWVNVNGFCVLRIQEIGELFVDSEKSTKSGIFNRIDPKMLGFLMFFGAVSLAAVVVLTTLHLIGIL